MLNSPVSPQKLVFSLIISAAAAGCQGSIGTHGNSTGQAGGSVSGAAGVTGSGTAGSTTVTGVAGSGVDTVVMDCLASNGVLNAGLTPARRLTRERAPHAGRLNKLGSFCRSHQM